MDSMQLPLVGGLVALLILLLVVRSTSRRRAHRTADAGPEASVDGAAAPLAADADPDADPDADESIEQPFLGLDLLEPVAPDPEPLDAASAEQIDEVGAPETEAPVAPARRRWFGRRGRAASEAPVAGLEHHEVVDLTPDEFGAVLDGWPAQPTEPAAEAEVEAEGRAEDEEPAQLTVPAAEAEGEVADEEPAQPVVAKRRGWFGRRRDRSAAAVEPVLEAGEVAPDLAPTTAGGLVAADAVAADDAEERAEPDGSSDQSELKALREQLRALELVVQQQSADHPTAALARVEETVAEQSAAYLRQVSLVVSGLAAHTSEDENPRRTLARVAAAVERLGVPNSMERPILPASHELSSRSHADGSRHPSHLLEPQERGADDEAGEPTSTQIADVFAGLDAAVAPVHPGAPAVSAGAGVTEPLLPPLVQPAAQQPVQQAEQQAVQPGSRPLIDGLSGLSTEPQPTASMPVFGQPSGNLHDLSALAAYDNSDYDRGYDAAAEGGIPAFEPPAVLPVPPPAAPEQSGRRRGRRSRSKSS